MIGVTFECGHSVVATGSEQQLACHCGETRVRFLQVRAPRFKGHVSGPHAEFEALPAIAVELKGDKNGG